MFAVVKLFRQMTYKLKVRQRLAALCRKSIRVVIGADPHPNHRARAELLLKVTYLRESSQVEGAVPGREEVVKGAERRERRRRRSQQLLMLLNFAWRSKGARVGPAR